MCPTKASPNNYYCAGLEAKAAWTLVSTRGNIRVLAITCNLEHESTKRSNWSCLNRTCCLYLVFQFVINRGIFSYSNWHTSLRCCRTCCSSTAYMEGFPTFPSRNCTEWQDLRRTESMSTMCVAEIPAYYGPLPVRAWKIALASWVWRFSYARFIHY